MNDIYYIGKDCQTKSPCGTLLRSSIAKIGLCVVCLLGATACIDEDLSDCGYDFVIDYHVQLSDGMQTELDEELSYPEEQPIRQALEAALTGLFTYPVQDLEQVFFPTAGTATYATYAMHALDATQTIYLKEPTYRHLAVGNQPQEPCVTLAAIDQPTTYALQGEAADTISSHTQGLFTGRLSMTMLPTATNQRMDLYMANCATALVLDYGDSQPEDLFCYATGFADRFTVNDSCYYFDKPHVVRTVRVDDAANRCAFYAVHFPSALTPAKDNGYWQMHLCVKQGGSYTKYTFTARKPVKAGDLQIIKMRLHNGEVEADTKEVGISVSLDWKPGGNYHIDVEI